MLTPVFRPVRAETARDKPCGALAARAEALQAVVLALGNLNHLTRGAICTHSGQLPAPDATGVSAVRSSG